MESFKGQRIVGKVYRNEDFSGTDFSGAELINVTFRMCDFRGADFSGLKLKDVAFEECLFDVIEIDDFWFTVELVQFYEADIRALYEIARNKPDIYYTVLPQNISCPVDTTGQELIVYKKVHVDADFVCYDNAVAKLRIPADAERITYKGDKCRSSCAQVLEIKDKLGNSYDIGCSAYYPIAQEYKVGSMIYANSFDNNPLTVCSNGIHFFLTEEEAWEYTG